MPYLKSDEWNPAMLPLPFFMFIVAFLEFVPASCVLGGLYGAVLGDVEASSWDNVKDGAYNGFFYSVIFVTLFTLVMQIPFLPQMKEIYKDACLKSELKEIYQDIKSSQFFSRFFSWRETASEKIDSESQSLKERSSIKLD